MNILSLPPFPLQAVREAVAEVLRAASAPGPVDADGGGGGGGGGGGLLAAAGLCLVPDPPPVHLHPAHVHADPESLLAAALAAGAFLGGYIHDYLRSKGEGGNYMPAPNHIDPDGQ